jgi:AbrB family looped-hinge helix DNA binding protein
MDSQGRIVIPAAAREALDIACGEPMSLVVDDGQIRLLTIRQAVKNAQAIARKHKKGRTGLVDEFLRERRADSGE